MISLIGVVVVRVAAGNFQERRRHPLGRVRSLRVASASLAGRLSRIDAEGFLPFAVHDRRPPSATTMRFTHRPGLARSGRD